MLTTLPVRVNGIPNPLALPFEKHAHLLGWGDPLRSAPLCRVLQVLEAPAGRGE